MSGTVIKTRKIHLLFTLRAVARWDSRWRKQAAGEWGAKYEPVIAAYGRHTGGGEAEARRVRQTSGGQEHQSGYFTLDRWSGLLGARVQGNQSCSVSLIA
jgi:hypothetical protein